MKKFLWSLLVLMIFAPSALAAEKVQGEVFAGMNVSNMTRFDSKVGFQVGARMEIPMKMIVNGAYINGAFALTLKGAQSDLGHERFSSDAYYFEIPIHVGYKHYFNEKVGIFGEFGPYFAMGSFGRTGIKTDIGGMSYDTFSDIGPNGLKNFDMGLGFRVGAEIARKVPIALGYDFGIVNIARNDYSCKNSNFYITVGYKF